MLHERHISQTFSDALCPYCRSGFNRSNIDLAVKCLACSTRHHKSCWSYTGRCSVFGCDGTKAIALPAAWRIRMRVWLNTPWYGPATSTAEERKLTQTQKIILIVGLCLIALSYGAPLVAGLVAALLL